MEIDAIRTLPQEFRTIADMLDAYMPPAARAWRDAADRVEAAIRAHAAEILTIRRAAREYGWNYEALRRRISGNPDMNVGNEGAPRVTRGAMEMLGRGRGPRSRSPEGSATPKYASVCPDRPNGYGETTERTAPRFSGDARWRSIMDRATRGRGR